MESDDDHAVEEDERLADEESEEEEEEEVEEVPTVAKAELLITTEMVDFRDDPPDKLKEVVIPGRVMGTYEEILKALKEPRTTPPILFKFERTSVLGHRAIQLANGAATYIKTETTDPHAIAMEELLAGKLPFIIGRHLPFKTEYWRLTELRML
jgi:DNA-directed RNA polymerase subunit K/omega